MEEEQSETQGRLWTEKAPVPVDKPPTLNMYSGEAEKQKPHSLRCIPLLKMFTSQASVSWQTLSLPSPLCTVTCHAMGRRLGPPKVPSSLSYPRAVVTPGKRINGLPKARAKHTTYMSKNPSHHPTPVSPFLRKVLLFPALPQELWASSDVIPMWEGDHWTLCSTIWMNRLRKLGNRYAEKY